MLPIVAKRRKLDSTPAKSEKSVENSENEVRLCLRWKEKYLNFLEFHGFVHSFCHKMLSLSTAVLAKYFVYWKLGFNYLERTNRITSSLKGHSHMAEETSSFRPAFLHQGLASLGPLRGR